MEVSTHFEWTDELVAEYSLASQSLTLWDFKRKKLVEWQLLLKTGELDVLNRQLDIDGAPDSIEYSVPMDVYVGFNKHFSQLPFLLTSFLISTTRPSISFTYNGRNFVITQSN